MGQARLVYVKRYQPQHPHHVTVSPRGRVLVVQGLWADEEHEREKEISYILASILIQGNIVGHTMSRCRHASVGLSATFLAVQGNRAR